MEETKEIWQSVESTDSMESTAGQDNESAHAGRQPEGDNDDNNNNDDHDDDNYINNNDDIEDRTQVESAASTESKRAICKELHRAVKSSRDKLFFVRSKKEGTNEDGDDDDDDDSDDYHNKYEWFVAQVDPDELRESPRMGKKNGRYSMRFYIPCVGDCKKKIRRLCQYHPLFHEFNPRTGLFGDIVPTTPTKARDLMRRRGDVTTVEPLWYMKSMNLVDEAIHGPFDFRGKKTYTIPFSEWMGLYDNARALDVDVSNIDAIDPLPGLE